MIEEEARKKMCPYMTEFLAAAFNGSVQDLEFLCQEVMRQKARADSLVQMEREKIAAWLMCSEDCRYRSTDGNCTRLNDLCSAYVADCIRNGEQP